MRSVDRDCYVKAAFSGPFGGNYEQVSARMTREEAYAVADGIQTAKLTGDMAHIKAIEVIRLKKAI